MEETSGHAKSGAMVSVKTPKPCSSGPANEKASSDASSGLGICKARNTTPANIRGIASEEIAKFSPEAKRNPCATHSENRRSSAKRRSFAEVAGLAIRDKKAPSSANAIAPPWAIFASKGTNQEASKIAALKSNSPKVKGREIPAKAISSNKSEVAFLNKAAMPVRAMT